MSTPYFVIYQYPKDYPKHFVLRQWLLKVSQMIPQQDATLCDTLDQARALVPAGFTSVGREPDDDPVIVETFMPHDAACLYLAGKKAAGKVVPS